MSESSAVSKQTALHSRHVALDGRMVDFAGWDMPIQYQSQMDEHHAVRQSVGMFDVSHMCVVDITGAQTKPFLQRLLANDIAPLAPRKAFYSCMLNEQAGIIDDLITYAMAEDWARIVVNAGTSEKDIAWMQAQAAEFDVVVAAKRQLSIIAVQGPNARAVAQPLLPQELVADELKVFSASGTQEGWFVGRTGYTGEDGFEIIAPHAEACELWDHLIEAGVVACGLGARDTLRLEAGMNLYGQDMDESTHPLNSGLDWTIAWEPADRNFLGRDSLEEKKNAGVPEKFVGLLLEGRGVIRHGYVVKTSAGDGVITSGGFSPTLKRSIALARVPKAADGEFNVEIRGKLVAARQVKPPFVRNGEAKIEI